MIEGQPFSLKAALPAWLPVEDLYIGMAGAAIFLCAVTVFTMMSPRNKMAMRVKMIQERHNEILSGVRPQTRKRKSPQQSVNLIRQIVTSMKLLKSSQINKMETLLFQGGIYSKDAIAILVFCNLVTPILGGLIGLLILGTIDKLMFNLHYALPLAGAYMGMKLPLWYVNRIRTHRYLMIQRSLPDTLDLMTICAEAGLSMAAAIDRVSRELAISYPEMAQELSTTSAEISILPDRNKALINLAERADLPEIRGVVNVLIQTERYGTPIANALRVLSAEFRQARMLRAEEKAARLPAIMTVPMIVFVLPTLFIVILTPAIINIMDTMK